MTIPRNPRLTLQKAIVKEAGFKKNLIRQGGNLVDYGKRLAKNPIKTLKKNFMTSGGTRLDTEKRFDVAENALEGALRGKKINFKALDKRKTDGNIFSRGVDYLRGTGILAAGRTTQGKFTRAQRLKIQRMMKDQGLLHKTKGGRYVIHRNADVNKMQDVYNKIQKMEAKGQIGMIDKVRNVTNYAPVPGERGLFLAGAGAGVAGQLADKETKDGRKRGLGERILRAGTMGALETAAAPIGIANRLYGGLGMAGEAALTMGGEALLRRNSKMPGAPSASYSQQRGANIRNAATQQPRPPQQQVKQASFPRNPRTVIRRTLR